jgi:hypothetical protein
MSYFSLKSCLIAPLPTSSRRCGGLARTLPLSTRHCVTLAFVPPSRLPWLVVALALIAPFLLRCSFLTRSLHLLPPICLLFSLAGCHVTSHCAASTSRCLSSHCRLSLTCGLVVVSPLVAPPPPCVSSLHPTTSFDALAGCCISSHHAALVGET